MQQKSQSVIKSAGLLTLAKFSSQYTIPSPQVKENFERQ